MNISFVDLKAQYSSIKKEIDRTVSGVISNAHFIQGPEVSLFEKEFAQYLGAAYCIGVNSGTDALILGIRSLELMPGDEVIVPVNTFIATALGVTENRLKPVFVDMDSEDYGISLDDLKKKITKKTKAIIVVHLYGKPDKLDEIQKIIRESGQKIYLIEDACQAHGALYNKKNVGGIGVFSAFSFYPGKNLGAYGDGGAIVTNDEALALKYRMSREYGQKVKYHHESLGINSRLDTMQAAILRVKLAHLDSWNKKRQALAGYYTKKLQLLSAHVKTPRDFINRKSVFHLYVIEVDNRDALLKYLNDRGIQALIHYPIPLHLQKAFGYLKYKKGDFPNAEKSADRILSLPIFPELTKTQIHTVVSTIQEFYER
jgi:dTDP-4-amino-4,6-dideoxygalactose transaminase